MRSVRYAFRDARTQMILSFRNSKTIILYIVAALWVIYCLQPIRTFSIETNELLNPLEPFVLLIASGDTFPSAFFYLFLFYVILLSDMPYINAGFRYRIIRMNRTGWSLGEIITVFMISFLYIIWLLLICWLILLGRYGGNGDWSRIVYTLTFTDAASQYNIELGLSDGLLYVFQPLTVFLHSITLMWLYYTFAGLLLIGLHLAYPKGRPFGAITALAVYLFDYIRIYALPFSFAWGSPATLSRLTTLDIGFDQRLPSPTYAYKFWAVSIVALMIALWAVTRHCTVDDASQNAN